MHSCSPAITDLSGLRWSLLVGALALQDAAGEIVEDMCPNCHLRHPPGQGKTATWMKVATDYLPFLNDLEQLMKSCAVIPANAARQVPNVDSIHQVEVCGPRDPQDGPYGAKKLSKGRVGVLIIDWMGDARELWKGLVKSLDSDLAWLKTVVNKVQKVRVCMHAARMHAAFDQ